MTTFARGWLVVAGIVVIKLGLAAGAIASAMNQRRAELIQSVDAAYFIVPRSELAQAVVSRQAAAEIERAYVEASKQRRGVIGTTTVVFLRNRHPGHISGRIQLAMAGRRPKGEVDIPGISQREDSVYVIDHGMTIDAPEYHGEKSVEWIRIDVH